jgi:outer membrane protein OmpA-like peptidoglycan-associated protein
MSQCRISSSPQNALRLNRCQCDILNMLRTKEDISLRKLIRRMADQPLTTVQEIALASEVKLQCELLALANLVVVSKKDGSIVYRRRRTSGLIAVNEHVPVLQQRNPTAPLTALAVATTLALAACAQVSTTTKPLQPYNVSQPVNAYHPMLSERIVQVAAQNGEMQYRYCAGEECPGPTPKVLLRVTERRSDQLGAPPGRGRTQDQKSLQDALSKFGRDAGKQAQPGSPIPLAVASKSLDQPSSKAGSNSDTEKQGGVEEVRTKPPLKVEKQSQKHIAAEEPVKVAATGNAQPLRTDRSFSSYDGLISFNNGSENLDEMTKEMVAKLAPQAREADLVRLRGHAATKILTEDHRKLAIGRSVAVKLEFVKHGVARTKILILNPKDNDLIETTEIRAPENRSVEIHIVSKKMSTS